MRLTLCKVVYGYVIKLLDLLDDQLLLINLS